MNKRVLIEDKLIYFSNAIDTDESKAYFKKLKETIDWEQDEIMMFGKKTKVPRLTSWYADPNVKYSYSGLELLPKQWTSELIELKSLAEKLSTHSFNSVLLNYYRDGADSMGWHSDDEKELGANPIIASLTFGYPRRFLIREKMDYKKKKEIELEDGSLLVMRGDFQETYQHSIPKTKKLVGERLNLTFRKVL